MGKGVIDIRESEINEIHSAINKSISNMDSFSNKISPAFKNENDVGIMNHIEDILSNIINDIQFNEAMKKNIKVAVLERNGLKLEDSILIK